MRKRIVLSVCFGLVYAASVILGDAASACSTFQAGLGHAVFFGTFFIIGTLPLILLLQVGLTRLIRRILHSESKRVPTLEFVPIALVSLLFLSSLIPESPEDHFVRFVADVPPASLHDVRCWHTRGYGNGIAVVSFRVSPSEFEKVLTRYAYQKTELPEGASLSLLRSLCARKGFPIDYPPEPMVVAYRYSVPRSNGDFYVSIYANAARSLVYVVRGDG